MRALTRWIVVAAALGLVAACDKLPGAGGGAASSTAEEMSLGSPTAKVTVSEYASVTCPHCARFNAEVFPAFKAKYIDTGKVKYVFKEYLTPPEGTAAAGFLVARCAGKDKYFAAIDALFHSQNELYQSGDQRGWVFRVGRGAGLSDEKIAACIQDEQALKALQDRVKDGERDQISGTPSFLVNGKKLEGQTLAGKTYNGGEITLEQLDAALAPLVK